MDFSQRGPVGYSGQGEVLRHTIHEPGPATGMVRLACLVCKKSWRQFPTFKNQEISHKNPDLGLFLANHKVCQLCQTMLHAELQLVLRAHVC